MTLSTFSDPNWLPTVAVVVPARNESAFIDKCLAALIAQSYPSNLLSVTVVDNESIDDTHAIATARGIRVVSIGNVLVGEVRNFGARLSHSDVIAFVDADCVVGCDWVRAAVDALRDPVVGAVGGDCLSNSAGTWVETAWKDTSPSQAARVSALPGASMAFRRTTFESVGGFNGNLSAGEDDDICARVRSQKLEIVAIPACQSVHLGYPRTLGAVAKRQIWHGSSQLDARDRTIDPQLVLVHLFLLGTVLLAFGVATVRVPLALTGLALVATPTITFAVAKARRRSHPVKRFGQLIPISFSYYSGRTCGLCINYIYVFRRRYHRLLALLQRLRD